MYCGTATNVVYGVLVSVVIFSRCLSTPIILRPNWYPYFKKTFEDSQATDNGQGIQTDRIPLQQRLALSFLRQSWIPHLPSELGRSVEDLETVLATRRDCQDATPGLLCYLQETTPFTVPQISTSSIVKGSTYRCRTPLVPPPTNAS